MVDKRKVLSIAIPTFNGGEFIGEALESIVSQIDDANRDIIEIVISDNASEDNTREVVDSFSGKRAEIRYFANTSNIGAPGNNALAMQRSTGDYVWLFSDDDVMKKGSVRRVLETIEKYSQLSVIFLNFSIYSRQLDRCENANVLKVDKDIFCETPDSFILTTDVASSFLSGIIFNRAFYMGVDRTKYKNSEWIQFGMLLNLLVKAPSYIISEPYVMYRSSVGRWESKGLLLQYSYINLPLLIGEATRGKYRPGTINTLLNNRRKALSSSIVSFKLQGFKIPVFGLIRVYHKYILFWLVDIPLMLIPSAVFVLMRRIYKMLRPNYDII